MLNLHNPRTGRRIFLCYWPEDDHWRLYGETGTITDGTRLDESWPTRAAVAARTEELRRRFERAGYLGSGEPYRVVPLHPLPPPPRPQ